MNKIYCFSTHPEGFEGVAYAMAEDGTVLGSHYCTHQGYASSDLGCDGSRPDRHEAYTAHYPEGYETEFISAKDQKDHEGLKSAIELNRRLGIKQYYDKGNEIEFRPLGNDNEEENAWRDYLRAEFGDPCWAWDVMEYRIKEKQQ